MYPSDYNLPLREKAPARAKNVVARKAASAKRAKNVVARKTAPARKADSAKKPMARRTTR